MCTAIFHFYFGLFLSLLVSGHFHQSQRSRRRVDALIASVSARRIAVLATEATASAAVVYDAHPTRLYQPQQAPVISARHPTVGPHAIILVLSPLIVFVVIVVLRTAVVFVDVAVVVAVSRFVGSVIIAVVGTTATTFLVSFPYVGHQLLPGQPILYRVHDHFGVHRTLVAEMFQQYARD